MSWRSYIRRLIRIRGQRSDNRKHWKHTLTNGIRPIRCCSLLFEHDDSGCALEIKVIINCFHLLIVNRVDDSAVVKYVFLFQEPASICCKFIHILFSFQRMCFGYGQRITYRIFVFCNLFPPLHWQNLLLFERA